MPLPKAPPAGASAGPVAPECWLCGEAALEAESDLVEVFCNQGDCCDAAGSRYHRDCMLAHIEKTGRIRKCHAGVADLRQIARMELTGAWTLGGRYRLPLAAPLTALCASARRLPLRALSP